MFPPRRGLSAGLMKSAATARRRALPPPGVAVRGVVGAMTAELRPHARPEARPLPCPDQGERDIIAGHAGRRLGR